MRALSEAADVFDAALLHAILTTLGAHLRPPPAAGRARRAGPVDRRRWQPLARLAADGLGPVAGRPASGRQDALSRLRCLRQGPVDVTVTAGNGSERAAWRRLVQPGGFYVVDRGYVDYELVSGAA